MKNKKRIITETKADVSPYDLATSLGDLHARIGQWIQQYGHDATLDWDPNFHYAYEHSPSPRFNIQVQRKETDQEYETRVAAEAAAQQVREARERAEFERLKNKFGE